MSAEHVEIGIQVLYVDRHMRNTLGTVNQYRYLMGMSHLNDLLHRIDGSQHIGNMGYRNQPGTRRESFSYSSSRSSPRSFIGITFSTIPLRMA